MNRPAPKPSRGGRKVVLAQRLRYIDPANIAKDFPSPKERKAIAAVFRWLALNSICAWRLKSGAYKTHLSMRDFKRMFDKNDAIVLDDELYEKARKLLAPDE